MSQKEVGVEMQIKRMVTPVTVLLYSLEEDKLKKDSQIRVDLSCYHHEQTRAYPMCSFYHIKENINPKDSYQSTDVEFTFPPPPPAPTYEKTLWQKLIHLTWTKVSGF